MDQGRCRTNRANDIHSMLALAIRDVRTGAPSITDPPGGNGPSEARGKRRERSKNEKLRLLPKRRLHPLPLPLGRGRGKAKKREKCYYLNQHGGCPKTAEECGFKHKKLPAAEVAKMAQPPSRAGSRAASPFGRRPGAKAKAAPKANAAGRKNPCYCFKSAKPGGCHDTNCEFMHLDEAMIEEFKRAGKVLQDNANTKP